MTCAQIEELLSDLIDDELGAGARTGVEAHLASCAECAAAYRALKRTVAFVRANASVDFVPGTPGERYRDFTRAMMDETDDRSPEQILLGGVFGG